MTANAAAVTFTAPKRTWTHPRIPENTTSSHLNEDGSANGALTRHTFKYDNSERRVESIEVSTVDGTATLRIKMSSISSRMRRQLSLLDDNIPSAPVPSHHQQQQRHHVDHIIRAAPPGITIGPHQLRRSGRAPTPRQAHHHGHTGTGPPAHRKHRRHQGQKRRQYQQLHLPVAAQWLDHHRRHRRHLHADGKRRPQNLPSADNLPGTYSETSIP